MSRAFSRGCLALLLLAGCPKGGDDTGASATEASDAGSGSASATTGTGTGGTGGEPYLYCPGVPEVAEPCVDDSECPPGGYYCAAYPDTCPGPGCFSECQGDAECEMGFVCEYTGTGCCALDTRTCVPACTAESCAEGDACQADGHCAPILCEGGGFTCPEGSTCAPNDAGADGHGCAVIPCDQAGALACGAVFECVAGACQRLACTTNDECPCGTCVKGECWERPWLCTIGSA